MQQSDLSTLSTPHLMTSCVYTGTVQWHVVISDTAAPAAAEARVTMAGCCSPVICYLQMRSIQFTIYTTASTPHQLRRTSVCAEPVYHLHHYIAVIIMAMSHVMCSVVIMAKVWFIIIHGTGADCGEVMFCRVWQQESSVTCAVMRARWCHVIVTS